MARIGMPVARITIRIDRATREYLDRLHADIAANDGEPMTDGALLRTIIRTCIGEPKKRVVIDETVNLISHMSKIALERVVAVVSSDLPKIFKAISKED